MFPFRKPYKLLWNFDSFPVLWLLNWIIFPLLLLLTLSFYFDLEFILTFLVVKAVTLRLERFLLITWLFLAWLLTFGFLSSPIGFNFPDFWPNTNAWTLWVLFYPSVLTDFDGFIVLFELSLCIVFYFYCFISVCSFYTRLGPFSMLNVLHG